MPRDARPTVPPKLPDTTPPFPSGDYSYTLEAVMGMQSSLGKLTEAIDSLKEQSKDHSKELKDIGKDVHAAKVGLRIIIGMIAVAGTVVGFILNRVADLVQAYINSPKAH